MLKEKYMPKAFLKFDLPEENDEFEVANKGGLYKLVLWDLDMYLRQILKYESDSYDEKTLEALQKTRDKLHELTNEYDVSL